MTYDVHLSPTNGFVPSSGTWAASVQGTQVALRTLPGGSPLGYATTYYARVVARDADGAAPAGAQGSGSMDRVSAEALSATAIDGKTITGSLMRTASTGKRLELGGAIVDQMRMYSGEASETRPGTAAA